MNTLMLLPNFEYHAPSELKDAYKVLDRLKEKTSIIAGGTDLIVNMKKGIISPENVISLNRIKNMGQEITEPEDGKIIICALNTITELSRNEFINRNFSGLAAAASSLGTPLIRNKATIGGNIVSARPAADLPPALMAYGGIVNLNSAGGERIVSLEDFFLGPGRTIIQEDEILTSIILDRPPDLSGCAYIKLGTRKAMEISIVNIAAFLTLEKPGGPIKNARVILGSVAPVPIRAPSAEKHLIGEKPEENLFISAGKAASEDCKPIDDYRASAEYRKDMVKVLTKRVLSEAMQSIKL